LRNISKYIKSVTTVFDTYVILKDKYEKDKDETKLNELYKNMLEIQMFHNNNGLFRRPDNMNSLTLRSEYSIDKSEVEKERRLFSPQKELKSNQESFDDVVEGLKVINTETGGTKPKFAKKAAPFNKKATIDTKAKITNITNINVIKHKPNKTVNSKDLKQSFEKIKVRNIFNPKKTDLLSPRNTVKKEPSSSSMITNIITKPLSIKTNRYNTINKSKADTNTKKSDKEISTIMRTSLTQLTKNEKVDLLSNDGIDYDKVSEEWMISPMNKIPIRSSKMVPSDKNVLRNGYRSLPKYMNLK
jgi:hypothetical protein